MGAQGQEHGLERGRAACLRQRPLTWAERRGRDGGGCARHRRPRVQRDDSHRVAEGRSGGSGRRTVPVPRVQWRREQEGRRAGALEVGQASGLQQGESVGEQRWSDKSERGQVRASCS